ncbi:unnamed protein product [Caenorhabditis sp. 36 PRJEB53466]|nr:unnamed protein product [Caenorhabditis sp. 36 PRJEB53466]
MMRADNLLISMHIFVRAVLANYNYYNTQMSPPRLECGSEGIRLHVSPTGSFGGHVYVRGFFPQTVCHLNYCTRLTNQPIIMDLPFRGPCNVRRRRNVTPPSISYDVTVIIQHHPLFVTSFDKAYRLNCIYRQQESLLQQRLNVSDIPSTALQSKSAPKCRYDVLSGSLNGPVVRFANVGDVVVHKWTCDSDRFGFVVHSCVVRDESGKDFQFIDERGCVTDASLFPEVTYSNDLQSAFTAVRAFRYADQVMVHFSCQITTCRRHENGCEGISPPICRPLDLGPIKVHYVKHNENESATAPKENVQTLSPRTETTSSRPSTTSSRPSTTSTSTARSISTRPVTSTVSSTTSSRQRPQHDENTSNKFGNGYDFPNVELGDGVGQDNTAEMGVKSSGVDSYGLEISRENVKGSSSKVPVIAEPEKLPKREVFHVETISKTMDSEMEALPFPTKASVYQHRSPRSHKGSAEELNITVEVETPKMLILENEPNEEKMKLTESEPVKCEKADYLVSSTLLLTTLVVMQVISVMALITQRFYYKKSIDKLIYQDDRPASRKY